jgi:hypothetical protein
MDKPNYIVPVDTHYSLSDVILDVATHQYKKDVSEKKIAKSDLQDLLGHYETHLAKASKELSFHELQLSLQMKSNLSSHDETPFVHVFTSLVDQGTGELDILYKRKQIVQEKLTSSPDYDAFLTEKKKKVSPMTRFLLNSEDKMSRRIQSFEASEKRKGNIVDGTIQVPLGEFFVDKNFGLVSETSDFSLFVPNVFNSSSSSTSTSTSYGSTITDDNKYTFHSKYPADATIYFQVHSKIKNSQGNDSYLLTGTGHLPLVKIISHVNKSIKSGNVMQCNDGDFVSIEIPLILNAISSQDPDAKLKEHVSLIKSKKGGGHVIAENLEDENGALEEGSLFIHIYINDKATRNFFLQHKSYSSETDNPFESPSTRDINDGNFPFASAAMRMHILRDMSPFISEFTRSFSAIKTDPETGKKITFNGWEFKPSLPEGHAIHFPYNKGTRHTAPGFTYYHDKANQRLPDAKFLLHLTKVVLDRHKNEISEEEFVNAANNLVIINTDNKKKEEEEEEEYSFHPKHTKVLEIASEILTTYANSMNYRGDYADMNTDTAVDFSKHDTIHLIQHSTGMIRIPSLSPIHRKHYYANEKKEEEEKKKKLKGKNSIKKSSVESSGSFFSVKISNYLHHRKSKKKWVAAKKVGTEMLGDAVMDRSGDCEDFSKLINRIVAGFQSSRSIHPNISAMRVILSHYRVFSVLSSVTSRNIKEAPSSAENRIEEEEEEKEKEKDKNKELSSLSTFHEIPLCGVEVGSKKDLKAGIGAHMWTLLLPNKMYLEHIQSTNSKLISLPNGETLGKQDIEEISHRILGKPIIGTYNDNDDDDNENVSTSSYSINKLKRTIKGKAIIPYYKSVNDNEGGKRKFLYDNLYPLVLEGTGAARSLKLALESYHNNVSDKVKSINSELARLEATARLMTGVQSDQITSEHLRRNESVFSPFSLPIVTNSIIDLNPNERADSFYRMLCEMFEQNEGNTDIRITPKNLVSIQKEINERLLITKNNSSEEGFITSAADINIPFSDKYNSSNNNNNDDDDNNDSDQYTTHRVIPVQLGPRTREEAEDWEKEGKPLIGYTYGVNLTDYLHKSKNIGMLKTIKSTKEEVTFIDKIMAHSPSSPYITLSPKEEREEAQRIAQLYENILNEDIDKTLTRSYFGKEGEIVHVHIYSRMDNISKREIQNLASVLEDNQFVGFEPVEVVAESYSKGHHVLRITVPVAVSGVKQLYFEDSSLYENLKKPFNRTTKTTTTRNEEMIKKKFLLENLKKTLGS